MSKPTPFLALLLLPFIVTGYALGQPVAHSASPASQATPQVLIQAEIVEATPAQAQAASSSSPVSDSGYPARLAAAGAECVSFPAWATGVDTTWGMQMSQGESLGVRPPLGTSLQVTPHVAPNHTLRLFIHLVRTEAGAASNGGFTTQDQHVMRAARDGEAVMLVFGGKGMADGKWLFVFVTARLLTDPAQAAANL